MMKKTTTFKELEHFTALKETELQEIIGGDNRGDNFVQKIMNSLFRRK